MKKVLEIITLASSAEAFIGNQFSYFQSTGRYEMHLICSNGPTLHDFVKKQGIKYQPIEISRTLAPWKDIKAIFQIARYIRMNKIDIVIAHYFPKASLLTSCACLLTSRRCKIMIAHGVLHDTMHGLLRKLVIWEQKFDVAFAKKVVCVSPSVARRRREDGIEKTVKQVVLGGGSVNGVDAIEKFNPTLVSQNIIHQLKTKYQITDNDFIIGFSGRIVHDKGIEELCEAFEILKERFPQKSIKLFIIGEPEKRDAVPQKTLDILHKNANVIFTGRIPYSDIQQYYLLMNVLVLPSYREGFPTVVLEAGAMGIPVIVSRSTGCIDSIKEGETGVFTDISAESISNNIEKFFNKDFARSIGKNARQYVLNNYDQRIIQTYMLEVLDKYAN